MPEIWSPPELAIDQRAYFSIGPLEMLVARGSCDWTVAWRHVHGPDASQVAAELPCERAELGDDAQERSFSSQESRGPLVLEPMLADRAVVVRPEQALTVAPRAEVRLFVTTPLWVALRAGDPEALMDLPSAQPKETWFGPSTIEGERCYAGRLPLCHDAAACGDPPHRALTPLLIRNRASQALAVERIRLPMPRLTLHRTKDGVFWTSRVSVLRKEGSEEVDVEVLPHAPQEAVAARQVGAARDPAGSNVMSRALDSVFSHSFLP